MHKLPLSFPAKSYPGIHFIGICGTAMAAVAADVRRAGTRITGSDSGIYPPMSDFLAAEGLDFHVGYDPKHIRAEYLIIVGNAISRGNPELEAALDLGCEICSLPEFICRRYLEGRTPVVVAGTHGKTTITSMTAHILSAAGRDPGWLIGGMPVSPPVPCSGGTGREFVIEGDEYDSAWNDKRPKFMHYRPQIGIISSVEFDHADIYEDIHAVARAFYQFARQLPGNGRLIVNGDDERACQAASSALCQVWTVGEGDHLDWRLRDLSDSDNSKLRCEFHTPGGIEGSVELSLLGRHNLRNAVFAVAAAAAVGVDPVFAAESLASFRGVSRRLEWVGEFNGIAVYDDFAHHPTAVAAAISAVRHRHPKARLAALLEPRSNTMVRKYHQAALENSLANADLVFIAPLHRGGRIPAADRLDVRSLIKGLGEKGVEAHATATFEEYFSTVGEKLTPGDVVVMMSNGSFGGLRDKLTDITAR